MKRLQIIASFVVMALMLGLLSVGAAGAETETEIVPDPLPGMVEGTGTHFEVTDSEYPNITVDSSETIHLFLESALEGAALRIESASGATSAQITLGGFAAATTYYKYEDANPAYVAFTTDASGSYTYTQDLSTPHSILVLISPSTTHIYDGDANGDCAAIGTWDSSSKTCTLNGDVNEAIWVRSDNITIDGNGYKVTPNCNIGVLLYHRTGVTLQNLDISGCSRGIVLDGSSNNTLIDNNLHGNVYGILLKNGSNDNTLANNNASSNNTAGIRVQHSNGNALTNNDASSNGGAVGRGIVFYRAGNSALTGNTVWNNSLLGIWIVGGPGNNSLIDNAVLGTSARPLKWAIKIDSGANYNALTGNTMSGARKTPFSSGLEFYNSSYNEVYNNNFSNNVRQIRINNSTGNVFNLAGPTGGNWFDNFDEPAEGCNNVSPADNFCDSPYFFTTYASQGGQDNLPWTRENGWLNAPPVADANGPYSVPEGSSVVLIGTGSSDPDGDPLTYSWDLDNDSVFETTGATPTFSASGLDGPSSQAVVLKVCDDSNACDTDTATVNIANVAPTVGAIAAPVAPVEMDTAVTATAAFTDPGTPDTHTAVWDWGDSSTSPGTVTETDGSGSVSGSHAYSTPGVYTVTLTVTDDDGDSGQSVFQYVVVYDPSAGFVTGGGWIHSPVGACEFDACTSNTTGKASFGFVSKYKKGATVPTGQTEFQFKAGKLNFHSDSYQWLVIAGARAQFKGTGTINGVGNYGFMLIAIDGDINGGGGSDQFRIKIWDKATGEVIYDNKMDVPEDADASTELGGGSIVIHKKK